jgi:CBS domain containing-hemolysin-like protein
MSEFIILIVLFILSAFFAASETALTTLSSLKLHLLIEQKARGAKLVKQLKDNPNDFLSTILIGGNLVNTAAASIATSITIQFFEARGWGNLGIAIGIATGISTFLILVFGEIAPKTVAIRNAEKLSILVAPVIVALQFVVKPIAYLIGFLSRPIVHLFGGKTPDKGPFITEEDIHIILATGEKQGVIEEEERQMISSIFDFGDTIVREVMTPRPDIIAADVNSSREDLINTVIESGHSRIPVYDGNMDNVIGLVYAKDLLKKGKEDVREYIRAAVFIPETKKVAELLHEMQSARTHLAIIVDEYGITAGLVTLEDLVEEIVGEIHDEFERDEKTIEKIDDNTYVVDGKLTLKDLNEQLGTFLPEKDYDTIGGYVFGELGKAPAVGDAVRYENILIGVERILRRRITRVKIIKLPKSFEDEGVGG